jgi:hypothetical protein
VKEKKREKKSNNRIGQKIKREREKRVGLHTHTERDREKRKGYSAPIFPSQQELCRLFILFASSIGGKAT